MSLFRSRNRQPPSVPCAPPTRTGYELGDARLTAVTVRTPDNCSRVLKANYLNGSDSDALHTFQP